MRIWKDVEVLVNYDTSIFCRFSGNNPDSTRGLLYVIKKPPYYNDDGLETASLLR